VKCAWAIVTCDLSGSTTLFLPVKGMIFEEKSYEHQILFEFLSKLSETFLILRRNERDAVKKM
jgi:hypothetical protein